MDWDEFLDRVRSGAELESPEQAATAIRAVFETLAERLTFDQSTDFAAQLPDEIADCLFRPPDAEAEQFSVQEFFQRVGRRAGLELSEATRQAHAVFEVLAEAVPREDLSEVVGGLPGEFRSLVYGEAGRGSRFQGSQEV